MIFVASPKLNEQDIASLFSKHEINHLPALICFLDKGIIGYGRFDSASNNFMGIHELPEFAHLYREADQFSRWTWMTNDTHEEIAPSSLAWLYALLRTHLNNCMLMQPDLLQYYNSVRDFLKCCVLALSRRLFLV
jgi:hypothetical protein